MAAQCWPNTAFRRAGHSFRRRADNRQRRSSEEDPSAASRVINAYANAIARLDNAGAHRAPGKHRALIAKMAHRRAPLVEADTRTNATVVARFNTQLGGAQRNVAWMLALGNHLAACAAPLGARP
jgi:hypothetical protein